MRTSRRDNAFTLIELLVVIAIIALLIAILLPALGEARRTAKLARCLANFKQLGVATHTYAAEFKEKHYTYSAQVGNWGPANTTYGDLQAPASDQDAAVKQLCDIVRRRGDRLPGETPVIASFFPYSRYSHVVLQDYLGQQLPDPIVACTEDKDRLQWGRDPKGYDQGLYTPNFGVGGGANWRHPYSSSYYLTIAAFDNNRQGFRAYPATYSSLFIPGGAKFQGRRISDVGSPSSKVQMYDQFGRHVRKVFDYKSYFGFDTARTIVMMFDQSASIRASKDANLGCDPNTLAQVTVQYNPTAGFPDPPNVTGALARPYYQYTRSGLRGIDFGGKEISGRAY